MAEIIYNDRKGATSEHSQGEKSPTKRGQQTSDQHDGTMGRNN